MEPTKDKFKRYESVITQFGKPILSQEDACSIYLNCELKRESRGQ